MAFLRGRKHRFDAWFVAVRLTIRVAHGRMPARRQGPRPSSVELSLSRGPTGGLNEGRRNGVAFDSALCWDSRTS